MGERCKLRPERNARWAVLGLLCFLMLGIYYGYDNPSSLKSQIESRFGHPANFEFMYSLLFTVYSTPNIILTLVGGILCDKFGVIYTMTGAALIAVVGQCVYCYGVQEISFETMIIGRTILSASGCLNVAVSAMLADWFRGKELAFAFCFNLSISRLGTVLSSNLGPLLYNEFGLLAAVWVSAAAPAVSVLSMLLLFPIEYRATVQIQRAEENGQIRDSKDQYCSDAQVSDPLLSSSSSSSGSSGSAKPIFSPNALINMTSDQGPASIAGFDSDNQRKVSISVGIDEPITMTSYHAIATLDAEAKMDQTSFVPLNMSPVNGSGRRTFIDSPSSLNADEKKKKKAPGFHSLKELPLQTWLLALLAFSLYGAVLPFNNIASSFLLERDYFQDPPHGCALTNTSQCESSTNRPNSDCPDSKWYQPPIPDVIVVDGKKYDPLTTDDIDCDDDKWSDGCGKQYCNHYSNAIVEAGVVMSIPFIMSVCCYPFAGLWVDRYGYRCYIMIVAAATLVIVHILLGTTDVNPIPLMVMQGTCYFCYASALWPSIAIATPPHLKGMAYGLALGLENVGLAAFPQVIAQIYIAQGDKYIPDVSYFFASVEILAFALGITLLRVEIARGGKLNQPTAIAQAVGAGKALNNK